MHGFPFHIDDVALFLAIAGAAVPLLRLLGVNSVLAFLIIGVVIGPNGLGRLTDTMPSLRFATFDHPDTAASFAELGVVLLLFLIGLEVSGPRLVAMRRLVFGMGGAQIVLSGLIVYGVAAGFGNAPATAFVIAGAFALSSTAIVLQLMTESARLGGEAGRACLAVLLMQDLIVVPILLFIQLLGGDAEGVLAFAVAKALGLAAVVIAAIIIAGRRAARPLLRLAADAKAPEALTAAALLMILATAAATASAGLSLALGAFLAGLLLAETEYRHEIEVTLAPFKSLFLGLFFMSVGMGLDLEAVLRNGVWLAPALLALLLMKAGILFALGKGFGLSRPATVETSFAMAPAGEFAFVILAAAAPVGLIEADVAQFMTALAGASMLLNPPLAAAGRRLARRMEQRSGKSLAATDADDWRRHVVIAGYGRVGRLLGGALSEAGAEHVAIDCDAALVADHRNKGAAISFGDARRIEILRKIGADRAAALAVTMSAHESTEEVVRAARKEWPDLLICARARDTVHARGLLKAGADKVISEALEAGLELSETVLIGIGAPDDETRNRIDRMRRAELARSRGAPEEDEASPA